MAIATAVIGAGPAGLLFCITARLRTNAPIWLFDKRETYERSHRLRMAAGPYRALVRELNDPRLDGLLAFLEECDFAPRVNELESCLSVLAAELGVCKERYSAAGQSLADVRAHLTADGRLAPDAPLIIVGADSVHSAVRELAWSSERPVERTHQYLTRLRVTGPDLPKMLGPLEHVRLSKVLTSLLDYRRVDASSADVDLFLTAEEHESVVILGASPKAPVVLTDDILRGLEAPLFVRIVNRLRRGFTGGACKLSLISTFKLEHRYTPAPALVIADTTVFLVGDAAVSLPFQRGMACLARCVQSLSRVHAELVSSAITNNDAVARYVADVEQARKRELGIVRARSNIVRVAREVIRVSSALPFPVQTWLFSEQESEKGSARPALSFWVNFVFATWAGIATIVGLLDSRWLWMTAIAYSVQVLGGVVYAAARALDAGHQRPVRALWRAQIVWLFVAGAVVAIRSGSLGTAAIGLLSWFTMGIPFIIGIYLFEWQHRRAERDDD